MLTSWLPIEKKIYCLLEFRSILLEMKNWFVLGKFSTKMKKTKVMMHSFKTKSFFFKEKDKIIPFLYSLTFKLNDFKIIFFFHFDARLLQILTYLWVWFTIKKCLGDRILEARIKKVCTNVYYAGCISLTNMILIASPKHCLYGETISNLIIPNPMSKEMKFYKSHTNPSIKCNKNEIYPWNFPFVVSQNN